ncbi:hypothetical protein DFH09DRAFT_1499015 [Mycena vulgaris]|nr:hypothetical protein DFH09DRAFT_1499015 [Mycena vulgaris]
MTGTFPTYAAMLKIFFKPPPPLDGHGTAYMPVGVDFGPFHCHDTSMPADATESRMIECSPELAVHWDEFHHEIRPLLALPPLESASPCALTQRQFTGKGLARHKRVTIFGDLVEERLATCYRQRNGTNDDRKTIVALLMNSHFVGTDDLLVELKLWTCMTDYVRSYMGILFSLRYILSADTPPVDRYHYLIELERRCSAWDNVCIVTSVGVYPPLSSLQLLTKLLVADNFPTTIFSTSLWGPTRFSDSPRATSAAKSGSDGNSGFFPPCRSLGSNLTALQTMYCRPRVSGLPRALTPFVVPRALKPVQPSMRRIKLEIEFMGGKLRCKERTAASFVGFISKREFTELYRIFFTSMFPLSDTVNC